MLERTNLGQENGVSHGAGKSHGASDCQEGSQDRRRLHVEATRLPCYVRNATFGGVLVAQGSKLKARTNENGELE